MIALLRLIARLAASPEPSQRAGECMASLTIYPTRDRQVRATPINPPIRRGRSS